MLEKEHRPSYLRSFGNRQIEFPSFVGSISRRPELGAYIRTIDLSDDHFLEWGYENTKELSLHDANTLAKRGVEISQINYSTWFDVLTHETPSANNDIDPPYVLHDRYMAQYQQAFIVLLLSYCNCLESLLVHDSLCFYTTRLGSHHAPSAFGLALTNLSNLKYFKLGCGNWPVESNAGLYYPSALFQRIFTLPKVEELALCLHQVSWDEEENTAEYLEETNTLLSVRKLEFEQCNLTEVAVGSILDKTPRVTSLVISSLARDISPTGMGTSTWLDCTALARSIAGKQKVDNTLPEFSRRKLLEHLSISITFYSSNSDHAGFSPSIFKLGGAYEHGDFENEDHSVEFGIKGSFGSMKHFTSLKTLEISPPVLLGWHVKLARPLAEVLPHSLIKLTLLNEMSYWKYYHWSFENLSSLVQAFVKNQNRGSLQVIEYHLFEDVFRRWKTQISELKELCSTVGVLFEHVLETRGDDEYDWDNSYDEMPPGDL